MLKGIHYRSPLAYQAITHILLGKARRRRFEIAAELLGGSSSVLDICAGTGGLKDFLPPAAAYTALDASPEFIRFMDTKNICCRQCTIEEAMDQTTHIGKFDAVVMIISLCQARAYDMDGILTGLKKMAKKCVIVEDVKTRPLRSVSRLMNYFCARDYYRPCTVFTRPEFETLMSAHGFVVSHHDERYSSAVYEEHERP